MVTMAIEHHHYEATGYVQRAFDFEEEPAERERRDVLRLRESLAPYLDTEQLRQLAASREDLHAALRSDRPPAEVLALIDTLSILLRPSSHEQIKSPTDV